MRCHICGQSQTRRRAQVGPYAYMECVGCGVFFVDPMPEGDSVPGADAHYTAVYYGGERREGEEDFESATLEGAAKRVERIEALLGRKGRLLDVGTGTGFQLAAAKARAWDVHGVEVSVRAAEFASQTHGVSVTIGTLQEAAFPDAVFDAVVLSHVLEHVPNPIGLLREVHRVLDPSGVVALALPNARGLVYSAYNMYHRLTRRYGRDKFSCSLAPPSHLYGFDPPSLRTALEAAGLRIEALVVTGKGDPDHYPVVSWKGAGPLWPAHRVLEKLGRKRGRGSLLECLARPAT